MFQLARWQQRQWRLARQMEVAWQKMRARRQARAWWRRHLASAARCDLCCTRLRRGEGWLLTPAQAAALSVADGDEGAWLVCKGCLRVWEEWVCISETSKVGL